MFEVALNTMLSLFVCMVVGYVGIRINVLTEEMIPTLNKFLLKITFPALMLAILNIELTKEIISVTPVSFLMAIIYILFLWIFAVILVKIFRINVTDRPIIIFSFVFTNVGFIGLALIQTVYDTQGIIYMSMFNIVFNVAVFTLGFYILHDSDMSKISIKKIFLSPVMIAIFIGLFLLFSQLIFPYVFISEELGTTRLPYFLSKSLNLIGGMTAPLAMVIVGASLAQTNVKSVFFDSRLHIFSLFKLVVAPILLFLILKPFIGDETLLTITIVFAGLPTATMSVIFAKELGLDHIFASKIVFITIIYSVFVTPLLFLL